MAIRSVLLVGNIPDHAEQYEPALTDRGYRVYLATTGLEALRIARSTRPTCIVCDSDRVRATLRVSPIQYYSCRACGHGWRVEAL